MPVFVEPASLLVSENASATSIGITLPSDPNYSPDQLSVTIDSLPTNGLVTLADGITAVRVGYSLTSAQLAGLMFTAAPGQFDATSQLTYAVTDPDGNTVAGAASLAIGSAIGNPVVAPASLLVSENTSATSIGITLPSDPNYSPDQLSVTIDSLPTNGLVTLADGITAVRVGYSLTSAQLAGLMFTAAPGQFDATSQLTYAVTDPDGNTVAGAASLAIGSAIGNPVVAPASLLVSENTSATSIGITLPSDPNYSPDQLSVTIDSLPTNGLVTLADGITAVRVGYSLTSAQLAGLMFTAAPGQFDATSQLTYAVTDPDGNTVAGAASLAIGSAIGNPVVAPASLLVSENASATSIGITLPSDPNYSPDQLSVTIDSLPTNGLVTLADGITAVRVGYSLTSAQLAGLMFTAAPGQFDATSQLTYAVTDPDGNTVAGAASLAIGSAIGNPVVALTGSNQTITVSYGTIDTGIGGNQIIIGDGNVIVFSNGQDTIIGGTGSVTIYGSSYSATVVAGIGDTTFNATDGNSVVFGGKGLLTFNGGSGQQVIVDQDGPVQVNGGSGWGTYIALGGGLVVAGSGGPSVLLGGNGAQLLSKGAGTAIFGAASSGNVIMSGIRSSGDNIFFGQAGTGHLSFIDGSANDLIGVGQGSNLITLGSGNDAVFANTNMTAVTQITASSGSLELACGGKSVELSVADQLGTNRCFEIFGFRVGEDHVVLSDLNAAGLSQALNDQVALQQSSAAITLADGSQDDFCWLGCAVISGVLNHLI